MARTVLSKRRSVDFVVAGVPAQQGSKTYVPTKAGPRARESNEAKLKPWRAAVAAAAHTAMRLHDDTVEPPLQGPAKLSATFVFPRPRSHYRSGKHAGELKPNAPDYHSKRPDLDKLLRAIGDSLAGIVVVDDAAIAEVEAVKVYGTPAAHIAVAELAP